MSLHFNLRVNGWDNVGQISIRRLTSLDKPASQAAGTTNRYEVRLDGRKMGTVEHDYDDGAFVLAHKALGLITERARKT